MIISNFWNKFIKALPENVAKIAAGILIGTIISSFLWAKTVRDVNEKVNYIAPIVDTLAFNKQDYDVLNNKVDSLYVMKDDVKDIKEDVSDIKQTVDKIEKERDDDRNWLRDFLTKQFDN